MSQDDAVQQSQPSCPTCAAHEALPGQFRQGGEEVSVEWTCFACGQQWYAIYTYSRTDLGAPAHPV